MKPDPIVLNAEGNQGIGSINGVATMYADVLGFEPLASSWKSDAEHSEKTFQHLYNTPLRKAEFDHYGIWTQFDKLAGGLLTSPSYGQGYGIQSMLLFDNLTMADKALSWLVNATYRLRAGIHVASALSVLVMREPTAGCGQNSVSGRMRRLEPRQCVGAVESVSPDSRSGRLFAAIHKDSSAHTRQLEGGRGAQLANCDDWRPGKSRHIVRKEGDRRRLHAENSGRPADPRSESSHAFKEGIRLARDKTLGQRTF